MAPLDTNTFQNNQTPLMLPEPSFWNRHKWVLVALVFVVAALIAVGVFATNLFVDKDREAKNAQVKDFETKLLCERTGGIFKPCQQRCSEGERCFDCKAICNCTKGSIWKDGKGCLDSNTSKSMNTSAIDTSGWQTYRNEEYGFEVKYPSDYIVESFYDNKVAQFEHVSFPHEGFQLIVSPDDNEGEVLLDDWTEIHSDYFTGWEHIVVNTIPMLQKSDSGNVVFINEKDVYTVSNGFDVGAGYIDLDTFNTILSTFKFIDN